MKFASSLNFAERSREGALTLGESLELIKAAGMNAVEIDLSRGIGAAILADEYFGLQAELLRNELDKAGFTVSSVHAPHDPTLYMPERNTTEDEIQKARTDAAKSARIAHLLGAKVLVTVATGDLHISVKP